MCQSGWAGADCSKRSESELDQLLADCVKRCSIHGVCAAGKCECGSGWEGERCDLMTCPNLCTVREDGTANGDCINGRCICNAGFGGDDCSIACPNQCSGHGTCHHSTVLVNSSDIDRVHDHLFEDATGGVFASETQKDHGAMVRRHRYTCYCQPGYTGEDCSLIATLVDALEVGGGLTGDVGTRHKEQTSIASSVILVAIGTFAIGLCAVPFVKAVLDQRSKTRRKLIMEKKSSLEAYIY